MRTKFALKNIAIQVITLLSGVVLYFFCTPYLLKKLGVEVFGINQLLLQTVGYFGIAELGVGLSLTVLLYKEIVHENKENINALLSAAQRIFMIIGISIIVVGVLFSFYIADIFSLSPEYARSTQIAFVIYILNAAITYLASVPIILLNTTQKGFLNFRYQLMKPFLTYGGYVLLVYLGFSIIGIASVSFGVTVWSLIGSNYIAKKEFPWMNMWLKSKNYIVLHTTKYIFIEKLLILVLFQTDIILITYLLGIEFVSSYALYTVFFFYIKEIFLIGTNNIGNGAGEMYHQGNLDGLFTLWKDSLSIIFFVAIQLCIGIYFLFPHFFALWIDASLLLDHKILFFLAVNLFYILTLHATAIIVGSQNFYKKRMYGSLIEIVLNIGVSCLLIPKLGVLGAVIGTTVGHYATNVWFIPYLFLKSINQKKSIYLFMWLKYGLILILCSVLSWFFYTNFLLIMLDGIGTWGNLIAAVCIMAVFLFFTTLLFFYLLDDNFKKSIYRITFIVNFLMK